MIFGILLAAAAGASGPSMAIPTGSNIVSACNVIPEKRDLAGESALVTNLSRSCLIANGEAKTLSIHITRDAERRMVKLSCIPDPAGIGIEMNFCVDKHGIAVPLVASPVKP